MRVKPFFVLLTLLLAVVLLGTSIGQASPPAESSAPIRLKSMTFTPTAGDAPALPPGLTIASYNTNVRGYYLVQFQGPVEATWTEAVAAMGAELLDYVPEFAFKVRMSPAQAERVRQLDAVAWVGIFQPAYKLSPDLVVNGSHLYRVRLEQGANAGLTVAAIRSAGADITARDGNVLLVVANDDQVTAIAQVLDVAWIENYQLREKHNEYGAGVIMGATVANTNGYDGSTQTVAVADTGLGGGTASSAHPDIPSSRVSTIFDWPGTAGGCFSSVVNDGSIDVDSGHGTHVATSVLGDGDANGVGRGTAPAATLIFQSTEDYAVVSGFCQAFYGIRSGYYLLGLPNDVRSLFQQAYNAGARVHSDSWGSDVFGDYTIDSANADDFVWSHPDLTITFSASNAGTDSNADGVIDSDSIGSPATAKNVITVGASENDRQGNWDCDTSLAYSSCAAQGGQNDIFTWNSAWPNDYPANPIANDPSAGNAQQMGAFSGRGPTDDGRIKPDLVAPGSWVLSGYSGLYQQGYDSSANPQNGAWQYDGYGFPYSEQYKYMSGTSMSTPLVAGAAAVVRDYYQKAHSHNASAALVKATLINSAVDLLDENNDGANDNDYPIPNVHEGWGLVRVDRATDGSHVWEDNSAGVGTNGTASYPFAASSGTPFKVTLVWSDAASTETASQNLVNDLDLVVVAPNGTTYRGNQFSGGWSVTSGSADRTNNVENVYVQAPASGTWTVEVRGYNVPSGSQPFALVTDGNLGGTVIPTATATTPPAPTATNTPAPEPTATNTPPPEPTATTPPPTATSTPGNSSTSHIGDLDGASTNNGKTWTADVTITVHNGSDNPVANATVSGSWSHGASGSAACTTNGNGQCVVSKSGLRKNVSSVRFTVNSVSHGTLTYNPSANHDPDGDSNGTFITVLKP